MGKRRNAEVHLAAFHGDLEPPILRLVVLGNVHLGHDFDARDECRVHIAPRPQRFVHLPVDAKSHHRKLAARLDVNVARAGANRLHEQVIHEVDDRAAVDHRLDVRQIDFRGIGLQLHGRLVQIGRHRVDFEAFFVAPRQRALNAAAEREHGPYTQAGDPFDFVELLQILRIGHGHADRVANFEQRDRVQSLGHPARQQPHGDGVDHTVAEPRGRHPQVSFDERQDRILLHHARLDEHFAEPQSLLRAFRQR